MRIAIVGSRKYPHLEDVRALVRRIALDHPDATIESGGADGTDTAAESEAIAVGLQVDSFRVRQINDESYGIEEWHLGAQPYIRLMLDQPQFQNYDSGLIFRDMLIVENAERVVGFHDGFSRGTLVTLGFAKNYKRPITKYGIDSARYVKT